MQPLTCSIQQRATDPRQWLQAEVAAVRPALAGRRFNGYSRKPAEHGPPVPTCIMTTRWLLIVS
jgi:hypothetical protein